MFMIIMFMLYNTLVIIIYLIKINKHINFSYTTNLFNNPNTILIYFPD